MSAFNNIKCSAQIAFFGIKSWAENKRMLILALVLAVMSAKFCSEINDFAKSIGSSTNVLAIFPHMYNNRFFRLNIQFCIVLMFSNAPFHRGDSLFCVIRSGYKKWCVGQLFYIIASSMIYVLFIFLLTSFFSIPTLGFSSTWGKTFATMAQTNSIKYEISKGIQIQYTPFAALLNTMTLLFLLTIIIGLLIFLLSNLIGRGSGVIAATALILLGVVPDYTQLPALVVRFSPCSLTQLGKFDNLGYTRYPTIGYAYAFLGITSLILLMANIFVFFNRKIRFYAYCMDI